MKLFDTRGKLLGIAFLLAVFMSLLTPSVAHAATFDPTRIIDDGVFYNSSAMTTQQIQDFLNSQVQTCDTNHAGYVGDSGTAYNPPWVCLKDYYEDNTSTYTVSYTYQNTSGVVVNATRTFTHNNAYFYTALTNPTYKNGDYHQGLISMAATIQNIGGTRPANSISAAQIIWNAAQTYGINPQVLLVTLQKENGLIKDTWPAPWQYQQAMGYGCFDYTPCNSQYSGFYNQVISAAWQFRTYANNPNGYNFVPGPGNNVYYSPVTSTCPSPTYSTLNIQNQATASLYNYTPYQPNAAALAAGYGIGDGCSAYGNRNFWLYFNAWFGTTYMPSFNAVLVSQSLFPSIQAGQVVPVHMSYKNAGNVLWADDTTAASLGQYPVHLATANTTNRLSPFGLNWPFLARPGLTFSKVYESDGITLAPNQHIVNPGQIGEYDFSFTVPVDYQAGTYQESFFPVREGTSSWYMGGLSWLNVTVQPTTFVATFAGQSSYPTVNAGSVTTSYFDFKNTGTGTWYDESSKPIGIAPVHLATYIPINHSDQFGYGWTTNSRPSIVFSMVFESDGVTIAANQHIVQTGQIARFSFNFTIPVDTPTGMYREFFTPILEGASNWNISKAAWQDVTVNPTTWTAAFAGQSPYPTIAKGASTSAFFKIKNTGSGVWQDSTSASTGIAPVHLATTNIINRSSIFSIGWPNTARPAINFGKVYESDGSTLSATQHVVLPGQVAEFDFTLTAPLNATSGVYREFFTPILEGSSNWNLGPAMWLDIGIQ